MKKNYFDPTMNISRFSTENVVTTSGTTSTPIVAQSVDALPEGVTAAKSLKLSDILTF